MRNISKNTQGFVFHLFFPFKNKQTNKNPNKCTLFYSIYKETISLQCNTVLSSYLIVIGVNIPLLMDWLTDTDRMFWEFPQLNRTVGLPSTRYKWRNCSPKFFSLPLKIKMEIIRLLKAQNLLIPWHLQMQFLFLFFMYTLISYVFFFLLQICPLNLTVVPCHRK